MFLVYFCILFFSFSCFVFLTFFYNLCLSIEKAYKHRSSATCKSQTSCYFSWSSLFYTITLFYIILHSTSLFYIILQIQKNYYLTCRGTPLLNPRPLLSGICYWQYFFWILWFTPSRSHWIGTIFRQASGIIANFLAPYRSWAYAARPYEKRIASEHLPRRN